MLVPYEVPDEAIERVILVLCAESCAVSRLHRRVFHALVGSLGHSTELSAACEFGFGVWVIFEVTLSRSGASATSFAIGSSDRGEFLFFSKDFA